MSDKTLKEAVQYIANVYKSVEQEAKSWKFNQSDIDFELKKTNPMTVEYGILMMIKQSVDAKNATKH